MRYTPVTQPRPEQTCKLCDAHSRLIAAHPRLMDRALDLSLSTGGCVKFDLKAHDDNLHRALTGASNRQTLENFGRAAARAAGLHTVRIGNRHLLSRDY